MSSFLLGASSLAITGALLNLPSFLDITMPESTANVPNPFCGFGKGVQTDCAREYSTLYLDDGGDYYQNIPLVPLLQPSRGLDTIIAVDSSDDSGDGYGTCCGYNWPQGNALNWTRYYALSGRGQAQKLAFPNATTLPSDNSALYYTPTFFGCDPDDTTLPGTVPPLIVYLPNAPYTAYSNGTSGSTVSLPWGDVADALFANGVALGSTGLGGTVDGIPGWDTCLACAVADRARRRAGIPDRSPDCAACFEAYCAESKLDDVGLVDPDGTYDPPPVTGSAATGSYCYVSPACEYTDFYSPTCGCVDCDVTWPAACDGVVYNVSDVHYCSRYGIGVDQFCGLTPAAPFDDGYLEL